MSFRTELGRRIAGKPARQAEPVTYMVGGASDNPFARHGFGAIESGAKRRAQIKNWWGMYRQGGPFADAIDAYWLYSLAKGWDFVCEKGADSLMKDVVAWCDQEDVDFGMIMHEGILASCLGGDSYQEILQTEGGRPLGVISRPPYSFEKEWDIKGTVVGYLQYTNDNGVETPRPKIEPGRIINLKLFPMPGEMYGVSLVERAEDNLKQDCDVIESITKGIHKIGTPQTHVACGKSGDIVPKADLEQVKKEYIEMIASDVFVSGPDVTMNRVGDTLGNLDTYSNITLQRLACALGVPEEVLGLGRGSTEATANVRMEAFLLKISTIQETAARTFSRKLIDRITGQPGKVWIEFNQVRPEDFAKIADGVSKLRKDIDPDAIAPPQWCRTKLGIPLDAK